MANISGFGQGIVASAGIGPGAVITGPITVNNGAAFNGATTFNGAIIWNTYFYQPITDGSGTPGNVTQNVGHGRAAFASASSAVTVTNSFVGVNTTVLVVLTTNDATAILKNVVPAAGSFTVNLTANATGTTKFDYIVFQG